MIQTKQNTTKTRMDKFKSISFSLFLIISVFAGTAFVGTQDFSENKGGIASAQGVENVLDGHVKEITVGPYDSYIYAATTNDTLYKLDTDLNIVWSRNLENGIRTNILIEGNQIFFGGYGAGPAPLYAYSVTGDKQWSSGIPNVGDSLDGGDLISVQPYINDSTLLVSTLEASWYIEKSGNNVTKISDVPGSGRWGDGSYATDISMIKGANYFYWTDYNPGQIMQYNYQGTEEWVTVVDTGSSAYDQMYLDQNEADQSGQVFVTGHETVNTTLVDIDGTELWGKRSLDRVSNPVFYDDLLLTTYQDTIRQINKTDGNITDTITPKSGTDVTALDYNPDNQQIYYGLSDGTIGIVTPPSYISVTGEIRDQYNNTYAREGWFFEHESSDYSVNGKANLEGEYNAVLTKTGNYTVFAGWYGYDNWHQSPKYTVNVQDDMTYDIIWPTDKESYLDLYLNESSMAINQTQKAQAFYWNNETWTTYDVTDNTTFISGNESRASIDGREITAHNPGNVEITALFGNVNDSQTIYISDEEYIPPENGTSTPDIEEPELFINVDSKLMNQSSSQNYYVEWYNPETGDLENVTLDATVTSSNSSLISVENGYLQAYESKGIAEISAEYNGYKDSVNVSVANKTIEDIDILPSEYWISAFIGTWEDGLGQAFHWIFFISVIGATIGYLFGVLAGMGGIVLLSVFALVVGSFTLGMFLSVFVMVLYILLTMNPYRNYRS